MLMTSQPFPLVADLLGDYFALRETVSPFSKYQTDPEGYARDVLGVHWWSKQVEVARAIVEHQKVFVKASHNVGKTFLAGGLVNWHFDSFSPSITKTTAPTKAQVEDLTWKEVRVQRRGRDMLPKSPRIESYLSNGEINMAHFAAGYTARDANSFQGDHEANLFLVFEEATGIEPAFYQAGDGMLSSGSGNRWLAILNPTDTGSEAYQQEMAGGWHVITISALDHPNLAAELRGLPKPFPKAISLAWVLEKLKTWCTPIEANQARGSDVCWPPLDFCLERGIEPQWYRPGPLFEGRVLGRWPSTATNSVWSEGSFVAAATRRPELWREAERYRIQIGCDRAHFGEDFTSIHVRRGPVSLHHESHNGIDAPQTLDRLKKLCGEFSMVSNEEPKEVFVVVDDFHGGVVDYAVADGWNWEHLSASQTAVEPEYFLNRRSELWFTVAERASEGRLDLSGLPDDVLRELRRQCMGPKWTPNSKGQKVVEEKKVTKARLKRSPDDLDAMNLAYAPSAVGSSEAAAGGEREEL